MLELVLASAGDLQPYNIKYFIPFFSIHPMYSTVGPNLWIHSGALELENVTTYSDNTKGTMIAELDYLRKLWTLSQISRLTCILEDLLDLLHFKSNSKIIPFH